MQSMYFRGNLAQVIVSNNHNFSTELLMHSLNVANIARAIATAAGVTEDERNKIYELALLHDLGKSMVPEQILYKQGPLTENEFEVMKNHSLYSEELYLRSLTREKLTFLDRRSAKILRGHHEKFNGCGYPDKLKGEEILFECRIITIADIYDAICSPRIYRKEKIENPLKVMEEELNVSIDPLMFEKYSYSILKCLSDNYYK